jgi:TonB family protein
VTWCLAVLISVNVAFCSDDSSKVSTDLRHGYVHCGPERNLPPVPVYEHPCNHKPVGELKCGETVDVVSREGPWLKIMNGDKSERYISFYSVSYEKKYYLPIDLAAAEGPYEPDCKAFLAKLQTHCAVAVYQPDPEYPEEGRRAKLSGTVLLSLTVGTDGLVREVTVTKPLGHGFDEQAVRSVQKWRFEPAAANGRPIPARITVQVDFNIDK